MGETRQCSRDASLVVVVGGGIGGVGGLHSDSYRHLVAVCCRGGFLWLGCLNIAFCQHWYLQCGVVLEAGGLELRLMQFFGVIMPADVHSNANHSLRCITFSSAMIAVMTQWLVNTLVYL